MSETQNRPTIAEIFADELAAGDTLDEIILGDGAGGEGVDYQRGEAAGEIAYTEIRGHWIGRHGIETDWDWNWTFTAHATRAEAEAAYIEAIQTAQAQGVTWEPDVCPVWDRVAATW